MRTRQKQQPCVGGRCSPQQAPTLQQQQHSAVHSAQHSAHSKQTQPNRVHSGTAQHTQKSAVNKHSCSRYRSRSSLDNPNPTKTTDLPRHPTYHAQSHCGLNPFPLLVGTLCLTCSKSYKSGVAAPMQTANVWPCSERKKKEGCRYLTGQIVCEDVYGSGGWRRIAGC